MRTIKISANVFDTEDRYFGVKEETILNPIVSKVKSAISEMTDYKLVDDSPSLEISLVVSTHDTEHRGIDIYYRYNSEDAAYIGGQIKKALDDTYLWENVILSQDNCFITDTQDAIEISVGFIDNEVDFAIMRKRPEVIANAIALGVKKFIENSYH